MKEFRVIMIGRPPDFSEVINRFLNQERKYYSHELDKLRIIFIDYDSIEVVIMKSNPLGPDVACIKLFNYDGYEEFSPWDIRGIFRMIMQEVIEKIFIPNPL